VRRAWRRPALVAAIAAAALTLAGCTGMGVYHPLPAWSPGPLVPASVAQGVLRWDGECVRLEADDGTVWVVVWPEGTRLREDNVPPLLVDEGDRGIAYLGDRITLPGIPAEAALPGPQRDRLLDDLPAGCQTASVWFGVPLRSS
jgi:hypothetical protein